MPSSGRVKNLADAPEEVMALNTCARGRKSLRKRLFRCNRDRVAITFHQFSLTYREALSLVTGTPVSLVWFTFAELVCIDCYRGIADRDAGVSR